MDKFDIVIVGGGPAGLNLARFMSSTGCKILLVDKKQQFGDNIVCAEGVLRTTWEKYFNPPTSNWIATEIDHIRIWGADGENFTVHVPKIAYVLNRHVWEYELGVEVMNHNVEVMLQTEAMYLEPNRLVLNHNGRRIAVGFEYLACADGIVSRLGAQLGMDVKLSRYTMYVCAQQLVETNEIDANTMEFFIGPELAPHGYGWVFPKGDTIANVGIGIMPGCGMPQLYLDKLMRLRFTHYKVIRQQVGAIPGKVMTRFTKDRVLLLGDAARLAAPLSGDGIMNAVESAHYASNALKAANLRLYDRELKRNLIPYLVRNRRLKYVWDNMRAEEFTSLIRIGKTLYDGKELHGVSVSHTVMRLLTRLPRLSRLYLRSYVWGWQTR